MPDQAAAALAFLQRDVLKNIVPLKMLHAYSPTITCHYLELGAEAGVLVMLPPTVFSYDAEDYPDADWIVLLSTTGPAAAEALLDLVPAHAALVFKLFDPADREVVARRFPLRRVTGFISYTSPPESAWPPVAGVAESEVLDERSLEIFVARGHDRSDVQRRFAAGQAVSFAIERAGVLAAVCYVYQNFGPVWEIAGVYTLPEARRGGLGRRVVAAALHTLSQRGYTPRYHVNEENAPSVGLAQALGLVPFVTIEHFVCESRRSTSQHVIGGSEHVMFRSQHALGGPQHVTFRDRDGPCAPRFALDRFARRWRRGLAGRISHSVAPQLL